MPDCQPADRFQQTLREPLLNYDVYHENFCSQLETFEHVRERLQQPPEQVAQIPLFNLMHATQRLALDACSHLANCYSGGHDIGELQTFYEQAVAYWETYAYYNEAYNNSDKRDTPWAHFALAGPDYRYALAMVCFGILLGKQQLLPRLAPLIDYCNEKRDALLERLLDHCIVGRDAEAGTCRRNLPYSNAMPVFAAPHAERPALMANYLAAWYQASRREDYYDRHTSGYQFVGYWAWEAAAITLVLGIDDASYRHLPYYPKDMVDFARQSNACKLAAYVAPPQRFPSDLSFARMAIQLNHSCL